MLVPGKKSSGVINAHTILTLICIFSLQCLFLNLSIALDNSNSSNYLPTKGIIKKNAVKEEYVIKPGDEISISVKGYEGYSKTAIVGQDGKVIYLSNRKLQAEGLTLLQFEKQIEYMLQPYVSSPQIDISVKQTEVIIKPGDIINIIVKENEDYNQTVTVQKNGKIQYLKFGDIQVAGLTTSQIKTQIENILRELIFAPEVTVSTKPEDYVIKLGDTVNITVAGNQKYDQTSTVQQNGQIFHPLLGIIKASGKTAPMLQDEITEKLKPSIAEPQVLVSVQQGMELVKEFKPEEEKKLEEAKKEEKEEKEYLVSSGDILDIIVKDHGEYNLKVVVQPNGKISYPPLGEIQSAGFTERQIAQSIASNLSGYIDNPQITATVKGRADFTEVTFDQTFYYVIKPGDVIYIAVNERKNYDYVMVVQPNGRIYYPPLGEIQVVGRSVSTFIDILKSRLPFKLKPEQLQVSIRQFKSITEETDRVEAKFPLVLKRFGYDFFDGARKKILQIEKNLPTETLDTEKVQKDAISGFVGPMDMMDANVNATVPDKYILGPGDKITLTFWTDVLEPQTESFIVDENGEVVIEKIGKMVVRGMTLSQFQDAVKMGLSRVAYKNLQLFATLDKLRSIQIFITGETFRPGSYAVSAVTTLFNALYLCGGPSENGSLRNIMLIKRNETKVVDWYKFLMKGDSSQDYSLDAGDTIMIPLAGRTITITGEVKKPAVYELKEGENLKELIALAGDIRSTGFLQRIRIDSVDSSRKRVIIDVDLSNPDQPDTPILDGDTVTIFSIPSERMNTVTIEGKVRIPGVYQLKDGMRVSDLINIAQGLLGEAYMERADLLRLNPDRKTTTLISLDLSKALSGESENNVTLSQWDKLVIYSKWDVKWIANRAVDIHGAVQSPGTYERPDGMKVYDLLIKSGGTLPDAYLDRASLFRLDETGNMTKSIPINLKLAMQNDADNNVILQDGDSLLVYTYREARWEPKREVTVSGAIQNPGIFTRTDGMKVSDLIQIAGGILPDAYPDRILLLRLDERQMVTQGFFINLKLALQDDPKNNLELKDGDELKIYTYEEAKWEPKKQVMVSGAVQNPDTFERTDGMRVSSLIYRAGGILPNAYLERADIERFLPDSEMYMLISVNLAKAFSGDESADVLLDDGDSLKVYTLGEVQYKPKNIVTIYGAVQKPDTYNRSVNMKLSDLLFTAGGLLPGASKNVEISRINDDGISETISADITSLLKGDKTNDLDLKDEDIVFIRKDKAFLEMLRIVKLDGEVKYPGSYALRQNERLGELIKRAGGLTERAYPEASTITRKMEYLVLDEQQKSLRQVKNLLKELSDQEYSRESARAWLEQGGKIPSNSKTSTSTDQTTTSSLMSVVNEATGVGALTSIPQQIGSLGEELEEAKQYQYTMVTPARSIYSLLPPGRLLVDINQALTNPKAKDDIILEDGDIIIIPSKPAAVSVTGAVIQPSSLIYIQGKNLKEYVKMVGGYSRDADIKAVYVIKANGMVVKGEKIKLSPGDVIVVPTKVMIQKVSDRWGQFMSIIRFSIGTVATMYIIKLVIGRL